MNNPPDQPSIASTPESWDSEEEGRLSLSFVSRLSTPASDFVPTSERLPSMIGANHCCSGTCQGVRELHVDYEGNLESEYVQALRESILGYAVTCADCGASPTQLTFDDFDTEFMETCYPDGPATFTEQFNITPGTMGYNNESIWRMVDRPDKALIFTNFPNVAHRTENSAENYARLAGCKVICGGKEGPAWLVPARVGWRADPNSSLVFRRQLVQAQTAAFQRLNASSTYGTARFAAYVRIHNASTTSTDRGTFVRWSPRHTEAASGSSEPAP